MVDMVTFRTCACHDCSIGNRGNMVAAYCARKDGCNRCNHKIGFHAAEYCEDNRKKNCESAPGSACGECLEHCYNEEYRRDYRKTDCGVADDFFNEAACVEIAFAADCGKCPRENKNENCGSHRLEAIGNAFCEFLVSNNLTWYVEDESEDECCECADYKALGCIAVCECCDEVCAAEEAACIKHTAHAEEDECRNRKDKVEDCSPGVGLYGYNVFVYRCLIGFFRLCHRTIVEICDCYEEHHQKCEKCVIVGWDCLDEEHKAVNHGIRWKLCAYCRCPAGNRSDDADWCCCCIDEVSKLCTGNLEFIDDRTHYCAYCEAVEIVVDEDESAEAYCGKHCAFSASDFVCCPLAVCTGCARLCEKGYHNAKQDEEDEDVGIPAVTIDFFAHKRKGCRYSIEDIEICIE